MSTDTKLTVFAGLVLLLLVVCWAQAVIIARLLHRPPVRRVVDEPTRLLQLIPQQPVRHLHSVRGVAAVPQPRPSPPSRGGLMPTSGDHTIDIWIANIREEDAG